MDRKTYLASLPQKRMGAGLIIRDQQQRILMLRPSYKPNLEIPGGVVELDESPYEACKREVKEELGIEADILRMLVIDYNAADAERTECLMFVFYGGDLEEDAIRNIQVDGEEILGYEFLLLDDIGGRTTERLFRRIKKSIEAIEKGATYYLENQELL